VLAAEGTKRLASSPVGVPSSGAARATERRARQARPREEKASMVREVEGGEKRKEGASV
jgi:hypothetical protein